jgi:hypothetical protein
VTNSTGIISLEGVDVTTASGVLVKAGAGDWGTSGSNGGAAVLTADGQSLIGDLVADALSTITVDLKNLSSLTASINSANTAKAVYLTLDDTSLWNVTADSCLTGLSLSGGVTGTTIANIVGNGHTVYYDANNSANSALGGKTYDLTGGGTLMPLS